MTLSAHGTFDVTMTPTEPPEHQGCTATGRMLLDKQYAGDLTASGKGQMLTAMTDTKGSAAYVAIEQVSGALNGLQGGFVLQHAGTMRGGQDQLSITIVPDSGSGQLAGITGRMVIRIEERKHFYDLDYVLPEN